MRQESQTQKVSAGVLHEGEEQSGCECVGNWSLYISSQVNGQKVWADRPDYSWAEWQFCVIVGNVTEKSGVGQGRVSGWDKWVKLNEWTEQGSTDCDAENFDFDFLFLATRGLKKQCLTYKTFSSLRFCSADCRWRARKWFSTQGTLFIVSMAGRSLSSTDKQLLFITVRHVLIFCL